MVLEAIAELEDTPARPCHILHYGYPIRDRLASLGVDRFVRMTAEITMAVVRAVEALHPSGLFYTSAGPAREAGLVPLEQDPYAGTKRLDELSLRQVCRDTGTASVVARVFSVSGPYMTNRHVYAMADLISQATSGSEIRVQSPHPVRRSYVAVADVVSIALAVLLDDDVTDETFDAAGEEVVEIGQLAVRIRDIVGRSGLPIVRGVPTSSLVDDYVGDGSKMRALADRHGIHLMPLDEQIRETVLAWS